MTRRQRRAFIRDQRDRARKAPKETTMTTSYRNPEQEQRAERIDKAMRLYGFELSTEQGWSADACGYQGPDNYFATREAAEAELPNLARVLECDVDELRVVAVEVQS